VRAGNRLHGDVTGAKLRDIVLRCLWFDYRFLWETSGCGVVVVLLNFRGALAMTISRNRQHKTPTSYCYPLSLKFGVVEQALGTVA
jgi:hypothetical protein